MVVVAGEGRTYECAVTRASEVPGWPSSAAGGLPPALALAACASSTCTIEAEAFSLWRGVSLYTSILLSVGFPLVQLPQTAYS